MTPLRHLWKSLEEVLSNDMQERRAKHDAHMAPDHLIRERIHDLCTRYKIEEGDRWEKDLAFEVAQALLEEEKGLSEQEKRTLLLTRWIDAFYPPQADRACSVLAKTHVLEPICLTSVQSKFIENKELLGAYGDLLPYGQKILSSARYGFLGAALYGIETYINVQQAGVYAKVPVGLARVVGSACYSCCTALVGKSHDGHLCYAHISGPGSFTTKEVVPVLLEQAFGSGEYLIISPRRTFIDGADPKKIESAEKQNELFRAIAQENGIGFGTYTEMYPDDESVLHDTRMSYAICLTESGVQAQRTKQITHKTTVDRWSQEPVMELEKSAPKFETDFSF